VAYLYDHVAPLVIDDLARLLDVRWLVRPVLRDNILVKYGPRRGLLYECVCAVLLRALGHLSMGGPPKEKALGDLHGGHMRSLLAELCWPDLLAPRIGPHAQFFKQEGSVFYPQCPRGKDKFLDSTIRIFAGTKLPKSTTFPICSQEQDQIRLMTEQAAQEVLLMMPGGEGHMLISQLGSQVGAWATFCRKYNLSLARSLTEFLRLFPQHFVLPSDELTVKRAVAAPGYIPARLPTAQGDDMDEDDERDQKAKPGKRGKGRMAAVKRVRMEVLARRVAKKVKISKLHKKRTPEGRKKGRGIIPRRKVF